MKVAEFIVALSEADIAKSDCVCFQGPYSKKGGCQAARKALAHALLEADISIKEIARYFSKCTPVKEVVEAVEIEHRRPAG